MRAVEFDLTYKEEDEFRQAERASLGVFLKDICQLAHNAYPKILDLTMQYRVSVSRTGILAYLFVKSGDCLGDQKDVEMDERENTHVS